MIAEKFGKTPLDVGADRIARTAYATLASLALLRRTRNHPIRLAWSPDDARSTISAIEVYPAATMRGRGLSLAGHRKREGLALRRRLADFVCRELPGSAIPDTEVVGIDGLDAAVCVVAGRDFLTGGALAPEDLELAKKEGWIWAQPPAAATTN